MTEQLKEELFKYLKVPERQKKYYGDPIEPKLMEKRFKKWQKRYGEDLPEIKFHGLRHPSITYKLYLSDGDIKAVQGDSGHASAAMVTDNYSHMQDSRRFALSQKIGKSFYQHEDATEMETDRVSEEGVLDLANKLQKNPESLKKLLAALGIAN